MAKGVAKKRYTGEFKQMVVETMRNEKLGCREAGRRFDVAAQRICDWERIYLTEGPEALHIERRGRGSKGNPNGRPPKFDRKLEEDLLAENQRLRFEKLPDDIDLLLHSDQGWHYRHKQYVRMLQDKGIRQSMSHKGNCYDNAVMENFFGHLKSELLYLQEFESMEHFKQELIEYIDYYNNRRIKARLKGLPPALHRQQALEAA